MGKIILRRRFPNYICDGMPLGPNEEAYLSEINSTEEFFELEWVKKDCDWIEKWRVSKGIVKDKDLLMGIDKEGQHWAIAYIFEGELDLPEWEG